MGQPIKIAVISDTHDLLPSELLPRLASAHEIWHLGDVSSESILERLRGLEKPLFVVQGNMDPYPAWPQRLELERHGRRFALQHRPPTSDPTGLAALLFGHLHYPVNEQTNQGVRLLNPGAINGPRNGSVASFGWLGIEPDGQWSWSIEPLQQSQ